MPILEVSPIDEHDIAQVYPKLFDSAFAEQHMGRPGRWGGPGAELLKLDNPVAPNAFFDLLQGRAPDGAKVLAGPEQNPDHGPGWQVYLGLPKHMSVLWALVPENTRQRIEVAHQCAVRSTMRDFQNSITNDINRPPWEDCPATLFASFRYGTDPQQNPDLHSKIIFPNLGLHRDGRVERFTEEHFLQNLPGLGARYDDKLAHYLFVGMGALFWYPNGSRVPLGVPQRLCDRFDMNPNLRPLHQPVWQNRMAKPSESQLFAQWQREAEALSWGPTQAQAFLSRTQLCGKMDKALVNFRRDFRRDLRRGCQALQHAKASLLLLLQRQREDSQQPTQSHRRTIDHTRSR